MSDIDLATRLDGVKGPYTRYTKNNWAAFWVLSRYTYQYISIMFYFVFLATCTFDEKLETTLTTFLSCEQT